MDSTIIDNVLYRRSVAERTDWTYLDSSSEKQAPHTGIEHQISAIMLRYEQLLGIVASCECCSRKYRQKVSVQYPTNVTHSTKHGKPKELKGGLKVLSERGTVRITSWWDSSQ